MKICKTILNGGPFGIKKTEPPKSIYKLYFYMSYHDYIAYIGITEKYTMTRATNHVSFNDDIGKLIRGKQYYLCIIGTVDQLTDEDDKQYRKVVEYSI